jgi:hypothetical protein
MQYSLRALFVAVAFLAIGVYFLGLALGFQANLLAFFIGITILGALVGGGIAAACRLQKPWPRRGALIVATLAGTAAGSFALINSEWRGDGPYTGHPGPVQDEHYVAMTVGRSALAALVVGLCVVSIFPRAAGTAKAIETERGNLRSPYRLSRFAFWSIVFVALGYVWRPYLPYYAEQRANERLMDAINAGDADLVARRVPAVVDFHGGAKLAPRIFYLAQHWPEADVRLAALKSLQRFSAKAFQGLPLNDMLTHSATNDNNAQVRAAAAQWLAELRQ